jgi:hypothetical protein
VAVDVGAVAEGLFMGFLAPLVIGGPIVPARPIGSKTALAIGEGRPLGDIDRVAHVQLARVRVARKLAAIDRLEGLTASEWALGAALHDIVQATHPGFDAVLRRSSPKRLLDLAGLTVSAVAPPSTAHEALSRHTWFARMFEITRTDTMLSWWVGSAKFLGEDPPARLTAWPELRRVNQVKVPHALMDLPAAGGAVPAGPFAGAVMTFLERTPLTDLVTCTRDAPRFMWTDASLSFVASRAGRTLATRALAQAPQAKVDEALGRATRGLLTGNEWGAASVAMDVLAERALARAELALRRTEEGDLGLGEGDAAFARAAGAVTAREWIATRDMAFREDERRGLLQALEPLAASRPAKELAALLAPAAAR